MPRGKRNSLHRDSFEADIKYLQVPALNTKLFKNKNLADKSFQSCAPISWNLLPLSVRSAESLGSFRNRLKSHLFALAYPPQGPLLLQTGLLHTKCLTRNCPRIYDFGLPLLDLKSALEFLQKISAISFRLEVRLDRFRGYPCVPLCQ